MDVRGFDQLFPFHTLAETGNLSSSRETWGTFPWTIPIRRPMIRNAPSDLAGPRRIRQLLLPSVRPSERAEDARRGNRDLDIHSPASGPWTTASRRLAVIAAGRLPLERDSRRRLEEVLLDASGRRGTGSVSPTPSTARSPETGVPQDWLSTARAVDLADNGTRFDIQGQVAAGSLFRVLRLPPPQAQKRPGPNS